MDAAGRDRTASSASRASRRRTQQRTLEAYGVETIRCDLLDEAAVARLPDAPNVVFMAGRKFGLDRQRAAHLGHEHASARPGLPEYRAAGSSRSRPATSTGSRPWPRRLARGRSARARRRVRDELPRARTHLRVLQPTRAASRRHPAAELRDGDALRRARRPRAARVATASPSIVSMGSFNVIWQGDANAMALRRADARVDAAVDRQRGRPRGAQRPRRVPPSWRGCWTADVAFTGREADDALLSNGAWQGASSAAARRRSSG